MFDHSAPTPIPAGLIAQAILSTTERERMLYATSAISLAEMPAAITLPKREYREVAQ